MTLRRSSLTRRKFARMMPPKVGAPLRLPSHLAWTRGNRCEVESSGACSGKIEAHHVRENGNGGMGMSPAMTT